MPLIRGFTKLAEEGGTIPIPKHLGGLANLTGRSEVHVVVVRTTNTGRRPHLILHHPDQLPFISPLETVFLRDIVPYRTGVVHLPKEVIDEAKLMPGGTLEIKILGPANSGWLILHNRGVLRRSTLQERLGTRPLLGDSTWDSKHKKRQMILEY